MTISAKYYLSVNGGANVDGGVEVPSLATIRFVPFSTVGWLRVRWEIYDYPEGWATPAGWTKDPATGTIYSTDFNPVLITLPNVAALWGVWMARVLVNEQIDDDQNLLPNLYDDTTVWSMLSASGMRSMGAREEKHFTTAQTAVKHWVRSYQRNLFVLETLVNLRVGPTITNTGTGTLNDIASDQAGTPAGAIVFTGAGNATLNSIAGGTTSRPLLLIKRGTGTLTIANEGTGTAANRTVTQSGASVVINNGGAAWVFYDNTTSRWQLIERAPDFGAQTITTTGPVNAGSAVLTGSLQAAFANLGTGPYAGVGFVRTPYAASQVIIGTKDSGGTDRSVLQMASNRVQLGVQTALDTEIYGASTNLWGTTQVGIYKTSGSGFALLVGASSIAAALPRLGNSDVYASDGRNALAMSDANATVSSTQYSRKQNKFTGALTAIRTVTYPAPAGEDNSYTKHIECATTGFGITVSTGVGTTVTLNPSESYTLDFSPSGVRISSIGITSNVVDTFANRPAQGLKGRQFEPTDDAHVWVDDGAAWRPIISQRLGKEVPATGTLTNVQAAGLTNAATFSKVNGCWEYTWVGNGSAGATGGQAERLLYKAAPANGATGYRVTAHFRLLGPAQMGGTFSFIVGLGWRLASTGACEFMEWNTGNAGKSNPQRRRYTVDSTGTAPNFTFSAQVVSGADEVATKDIWLRIVRLTGGVRKFYISYDGIHFRKMNGQDTTANEFFTPDQILMTICVFADSATDTEMVSGAVIDSWEEESF